MPASSREDSSAMIPPPKMFPLFIGSLFLLIKRKAIPGQEGAGGGRDGI